MRQSRRRACLLRHGLATEQGRFLAPTRLLDCGLGGGSRLLQHLGGGDLQGLRRLNRPRRVVWSFCAALAFVFVFVFACSMVALGAARCHGIGTIFVQQPKVDAPPVQVHPADLHLHARANGVAQTAALAAQFLARLVKTEVFAAQLGDVHQAFDVHLVQRDKDAEAGD